MALSLSILDLAPVVEGSDVRTALEDSLVLAQHAEKFGYARYWVAEHHNMIGVASSATSLLIGYLAAGTSKIRVGSGGIMLPNHSPLVIAEQFGTLETLYPGRIDLGVGRAPGSDGYAMRAMRRDPRAGDEFPQDVQELQILLGSGIPNQAVFATPGRDTNVPIYILGSSMFGAQLAAMLGLPYAFASHFAPDA
ncbi:MAG TPA: MsnO8 family LLM class oxidoreductase, partial [Thermomicrobiales bacterium]|nr:MsnO8 family LLM class oxidoreductase [Thermomicrobiales bacterium]